MTSDIEIWARRRRRLSRGRRKTFMKSGSIPSPSIDFDVAILAPWGTSGRRRLATSPATVGSLAHTGADVRWRTDAVSGVAHTAAVSKASDNLLLAGLAPRDRRALFDDARPVPLQAGAMLAEAGNPLEHAYFPLDSSISLSVSVAGKQPSVVGLVGCEGMLGVPLILGSPTSGFSARVQGAGQAWQIEAPKFSAALADCAALRTLMNRYVHVHLLQMA